MFDVRESASSAPSALNWLPLVAALGLVLLPGLSFASDGASGFGALVTYFENLLKGDVGLLIIIFGTIAALISMVLFFGYQALWFLLGGALLVTIGYTSILKPMFTAELPRHELVIQLEVAEPADGIARVREP